MKNESRNAGYCMERTRKRAVYLLLGLLLLFIGTALAVFAACTDEELWMRIVAGLLGAAALLAGLYESYTALRDALFPEKSTLARSIRSQLPYPEEAPDVASLFAMVDGDLREHGSRFGQALIGAQWVLGDEASFIPRIRGIFTKDVTHRHQSNGRTQTTRILQLILVDDRWQVQITGFREARELYAAAECLRLRIPAARSGDENDYLEFMRLDEMERARFLLEFRSAEPQAAPHPQPRHEEAFVLRQADGINTSRISAARLEEQLEAVAGRTVSFALCPTKPFPAPEGMLDRMECFGGPNGYQLVLVFHDDAKGYGGYSSPVERQAALDALLTLWRESRLPDYAGWNPLKRMTASQMRNK